MNQIPDVPGTKENLPNWMPRAARNYIHHTEYGCSIRQLARQAGCHASTVMRQVRGIEARRDDLLVDEALTGIGALARAPGRSDNIEIKDISRMTNQSPRQFTLPAPDKKTIEREGRRILRRLCEPGACLAVARDMEKAVVVRETDAGNTVRTAVVDRPVAQAMALKDWISCAEPGRIMRYKITAVGRAALKRLLAQDDSVRSGFSDGPARFGAGGTRRTCARSARQARASISPASSPPAALTPRSMMRTEACSHTAAPQRVGSWHICCTRLQARWFRLSTAGFLLLQTCRAGQGLLVGSRRVCSDNRQRYMGSKAKKSIHQERPLWPV